MACQLKRLWTSTKLKIIKSASLSQVSYIQNHKRKISKAIQDLNKSRIYWLKCYYWLNFTFESSGSKGQEPVFSTYRVRFNTRSKYMHSTLDVPLIPKAATSIENPLTKKVSQKKKGEIEYRNSYYKQFGLLSYHLMHCLPTGVLLIPKELLHQSQHHPSNFKQDDIK